MTFREFLEADTDGLMSSRPIGETPPQGRQSTASSGGVLEKIVLAFMKIPFAVVKGAWLAAKQAVQTVGDITVPDKPLRAAAGLAKLATPPAVYAAMKMAGITESPSIVMAALANPFFIKAYRDQSWLR